MLLKEVQKLTLCLQPPIVGPTDRACLTMNNFGILNNRWVKEAYVCVRGEGLYQWVIRTLRLLGTDLFGQYSQVKNSKFAKLDGIFEYLYQFYHGAITIRERMIFRGTISPGMASAFPGWNNYTVSSSGTPMQADSWISGFDTGFHIETDTWDRIKAGIKLPK